MLHVELKVLPPSDQHDQHRVRATYWTYGGLPRRGTPGRTPIRVKQGAPTIVEQWGTYCETEAAANELVGKLRAALDILGLPIKDLDNPLAAAA